MTGGSERKTFDERPHQFQFKNISLASNLQIKKKIFVEKSPEKNTKTWGGKLTRWAKLYRVSFAKSNLHFVHLLKHLRQLVMSIRGSCALLILELGIFFIEPGLFHLVHDVLDLRLDFLFLKTNLPQVMHFESLAGEFVRAKRLGDIHLVLQMLDEPLPFLE